MNTAKTQNLVAATTIAGIITTRDTAIDTILGDYDAAYDALDPEDAAFDTDVAALIATRDADIKEALLDFDLTFCGDAASKIFAGHPERQGLAFLNESDKKLYLYIDSETVGAMEALISLRNADAFEVLSVYDAALAALDPDDVDYETDRDALRTTRDTDIDTVTGDYDADRATADNDLVAYTFVAASGGRYDFPPAWFDGPVWGAFEAGPTGDGKATEARRR